MFSPDIASKIRLGSQVVLEAAPDDIPLLPGSWKHGGRKYRNCEARRSTLIPGTLLAILAVLIVIPFAVLAYASLVTALPFSGNTDVS